MCSHIYPTHVLLRNVGDADTVHDIMRRALTSITPAFSAPAPAPFLTAAACAFTFNRAKHRYVVQVAQPDGQHACMKLCIIGDKNGNWWLNVAHRGRSDSSGGGAQSRALFLHAYAALCTHKDIAQYVDATAVHPRFKSYSGEAHMSPLHAQRVVESRHMMPPPVTAFLISRTAPHDAVQTAVSTITHCVYPQLFAPATICGALSLLMHIVSSLKREQRADVNRVAAITTNARASVLSSTSTPHFAVRFFTAYAVASLHSTLGSSANEHEWEREHVNAVLQHAASSVCNTCKEQGYMVVAAPASASAPAKEMGEAQAQAYAYAYACLVCGHSHSHGSQWGYGQ